MLRMVCGLCRNPGPGRASTLGSWLVFRRLGLTESRSLWIEVHGGWPCRSRRVWSLIQWFALVARGGVHATALRWPEGLPRLPLVWMLALPTLGFDLCHRW